MTVITTLQLGAYIPAFTLNFCYELGLKLTICIPQSSLPAGVDHYQLDIMHSQCRWTVPVSQQSPVGQCMVSSGYVLFQVVSIPIAADSRDTTPCQDD